MHTSVHRRSLWQLYEYMISSFEVRKLTPPRNHTFYLLNWYSCKYKTIDTQALANLVLLSRFRLAIVFFLFIVCVKPKGKRYKKWYLFNTLPQACNPYCVYLAIWSMFLWWGRYAYWFLSVSVCIFVKVIIFSSWCLSSLYSSI